MGQQVLLCFANFSDFHPDEYYKDYSSTEKQSVCHRGDGPAGVFGAETTDCDSPISLINATFQWINDNLKDTIDFVIWTGDSARHDSDEEIPRTEQQVVALNELLVQNFTEVFGKDDNINDTDPTNDFIIPIIPNFGNNDIMPHNIFTPGPNEWTKKFTRIWRKLIPEEQRHGFERGGWFSVEVIPRRLTVFSLNTLYFFSSNTAVDGCAAKAEPGYEQMEWLRIQLQFLRQRGMKAILMGHVPPARTESKQSWDETCWQKYTLWMKQYRDIIVGSVYGHMNIDHFLLQDFHDITAKTLKGEVRESSRMAIDDFTIQSSADYLTELRTGWSQLPDPSKYDSKSEVELGTFEEWLTDQLLHTKSKKSKHDKFLERIGGVWGERYSLSLVSPSVVPNYFPTMRVVEYNISGLDGTSIGRSGDPKQVDEQSCTTDDGVEDRQDSFEVVGKKGSGSVDERKKYHKPKKPGFTVPKPPSKSVPPGPAYSPQTFSWLGYTQYYANLTRINNDFTDDDKNVETDGWHDGKHSGKKPKEKSKNHHRKFEYEVEYDTRDDSTFSLRDLTMRNYLDLAGRIGQYKPAKGDRVQDQRQSVEEEEEEEADGEQDPTPRPGDEISALKKKKHKKHHGKKHKHRKIINKTWFSFVKRAYVGTRDEEELHDQFGLVDD